jgi:hemerythrin-like domain-containing protein
MKATDILMEEHRVIERVLDTLETAVFRLQNGEDVRPGVFLQAADFIQGFADGCHHKKEEGVLFRHMAANGMPANAGPIGVMLHEHNQGRLFTRQMRAAARNWESGDVTALQAAIENALNYTRLLRQHIAKEDGILFPMAGRVIPVEQQDQVALDFDQVEHEETGVGVHEHYLSLAETLEKEIEGG